MHLSCVCDRAVVQPGLLHSLGESGTPSARGSASEVLHPGENTSWTTGLRIFLSSPSTWGCHHFIQDLSEQSPRDELPLGRFGPKPVSRNCMKATWDDGHGRMPHQVQGERLRSAYYPSMPGSSEAPKPKLGRGSLTHPGSRAATGHSLNDPCRSAYQSHRQKPLQVPGSHGLWKPKIMLNPEIPNQYQCRNHAAWAF